VIKFQQSHKILILTQNQRVVDNSNPAPGRTRP
jgi:hypothetical protein